MGELDPFLALAAELADAAGEAIRPHFRQPIAVTDKPDLSPVTVADRAAEAAMRRLIIARFPQHGIIGEEYGPERADAEFVWVLDPIDGTKSFISGVPLFGTLIALAQQGRPILALAAATVFSTSPDMFKGPDAVAHGRVAAAAKLVRFGADCYAYGLLALGFIDLVIEASLKPYDFSAMVPIIEGAGGIATDWQGKPLTLASDGRVLVAGDRNAHREALALLAA